MLLIYNEIMNEYEIVKHKKLKRIAIVVNDIKFRNYHMHNDMEIIYVVKGNGFINTRLNKYAVNSDDIFILNAYEPHEIAASSESLSCIIILVSNNFLNDYTTKIKSTIFQSGSIKGSLSPKDYKTIKNDIVASAKAYFKEEPLFELDCINKISNILYTLFTKTKITTLSESDFNLKVKKNNRLNRIIEYIDNNYENKITLKSVADTENISPYYLSHIFTEEIGVSFQNYLVNVRLENALRLIHDKSLTISNISLLSGFSELKYMTKAFVKTFGVKPNEYREKNLGTDISKYTKQLEHIYSNIESIKYIDKLLKRDVA